MKTGQIQNKIKEWARTVWKDGSYKRFNDLHLDDIDPIFQDCRNWFCGGILCLNTAIAIKKTEKIPLVFQLQFPLRSKRTPYGVNFKTIDEFSEEFENTPPSLYLLDKIPYTSNKRKKFDFIPAVFQSFYLETLTPADPDYCRFLVITEK